MQPSKPSRRERGTIPWAVPVLAGVIAALIVIARVIKPGAPVIAPSPSASGSAAAASSSTGAGATAAPFKPRCGPFPSAPFIIGEGPKTKSKPDLPEGMAPPEEEPEDEIAPFAVELGQGTVVEGGFAVGVRRDGEGGAVALIATIDASGSNGNLVRLGRSRGDMDPPVVAGAGASVIAAMMEPNAGGRAIKLAKVTGTDVTWGPELSEGRDESLALDVAVASGRGVVTWDDVPRGEKRSRVMFAAFEIAGMTLTSPAKPISPPSGDAEIPKLTVRPGGYWIAYVTQGEEIKKNDKKASKKKKADDDEDVEERDDRASGEAITHRWIEVAPLDEAGSPIAPPRAVTPKTGYVVSFDLDLGDDGAALLAYRDDDTPSGAAGGRLHSVLVRLSGASEPKVLSDDSRAAGAPDLLAGWIAIASVHGPTQLASVGPKGDLLDALMPEPSLGSGEPIAASKAGLLWARPAGKSMRIGLVTCAKAP